MEQGRITKDALVKERQTVLASWETGKEAASLDASWEYHGRLPEAKRFPAALTAAAADGVTLIQPRAGVTLVDDHIRLIKRLQDEGTADLLPVTVDSYTRHNRYKEAQAGIEESREAGRSMLNGLPVVNHGVAACRRIVEQLDRPVQIRHGTPDARLLAEISLAAGFTAYEGGGISYNIPYAKDISLEKSIRDWQYVDRLVGLYADNGVIINREPFGPLTGTLIPPCLSNAVAVLEALLAAEQGVMDITVGYGQCGSLEQDVAAVRALNKITMDVLGENGYTGINVTTVLHQWMGGFPQDEAKAYGVISWGAAAASFAGATKVITKTPHEALGVPSAEANINGLKTSRQVINLLADQAIPAAESLDVEYEFICRETRCLVDKVLELGEGSTGEGVVKAFKAGVLDVPFAPSKLTQGKVLPARDACGAVRFMEFGSLPMHGGIKDFHREKLEERGRLEGRPVSFQMVTDDIYAVSKGRLVGKP